MFDGKVIENALKTQENLLKAAQQSNEIEVRQIFEEMLFSNERLTVYLRQSISMLSEETADFENEDSSAEAYGISIRKEIFNQKSAYVIDLPFLLPNRRTATTYVKRTIIAALRKQLSSFCRENCVTPLDKASVTFVSFYAHSANRKLRHDNDNTEVSSVLNALTGLLIPDDSSLCCDLHILSRSSNKSFSRVMIEQTDF